MLPRGRTRLHAFVAVGVIAATQRVVVLSVEPWMGRTNWPKPLFVDGQRRVIAHGSASGMAFHDLGPDLVDATFQPVPKTITLVTYSIANPGSPAKWSIVAAPPATWSYVAVLSPDGRRIAWETLDVHSAPRPFWGNRWPRVWRLRSRMSRGRTSIWVSSIEGGAPTRVATQGFPVDGSLPGVIRWLPDSRHVSIDWNDQLYAVGAD